ncbi:UNVERIFIED_CONTAM: hypothetical protein GTU68_041417 [Idotea baltica]|nr:hypothetical protein [Idotea baltica]
MELRHLRYFLAVAEECHFGRAAENLHIVPSALSMQIKDLETELGGALFTRTSRRVELTETGKLFQIEAKSTLVQAERAKIIARNSVDGTIGRIRIGILGNAVLSNMLATHLRAFHQLFPKIEVQLVEVDPSLQNQSILNNVIDVAYGPNVELPDKTDLQLVAIGHWPIIAALNVNDPLAAKESIPLETLSTAPLVLYNQQLKSLNLVKHLGANLNIVSKVNSSFSMLALVAAGFGVALIPEPLRIISIPQLVYRPIQPIKLIAQLSFIYRKVETNGAVNSYIRQVLSSNSSIR